MRYNKMLPLHTVQRDCGGGTMGRQNTAVTNITAAGPPVARNQDTILPSAFTAPRASPSNALHSTLCISKTVLETHSQALSLFAVMYTDITTYTAWQQQHIAFKTLRCVVANTKYIMAFNCSITG